MNFQARLVLPLALVAALSSCASAPIQTYKGAALPAGQTARFSYSGDWMLKVILYKVDGDLALESGKTHQGTYTDSSNMGFDLLLKPGPHRFELVLLEENVVKDLSFVAEAGATYVLDREQKQVLRSDGGKRTPVEAQWVTVPFYEEPTDPSSATLALEGGLGTVTLYRIDGKPGRQSFLRSNYRFNSDGDGSFKVRLSPGAHTLEYRLHNTKGYFSANVLLKQVTLEAGKLYNIRPLAHEDKQTGATLGDIELVANTP